MGVKIIVDSACDLPQDEAKELDVKILPLKTIFGTEEYLDGVTLTNKEFFEKLIENTDLPHTSQITPYEYEKAFEEALKDHDEVLCITLSKKLSGCYQSANLAADEFEGEIQIVDSENVCIGQSILVKVACKLRDEGKSAKDIANVLNKKKHDVRVLALLDTLEYLRKGGRISSTTAFVGTLLSIKPVITVEEGKVKMKGKARGSKNGGNKLRELIQSSKGIDFNLPFALAYSGLTDVLLLKYIEDHKDLYSEHTGELPIYSIGSTIGTHVGPGGIAVAFFEKE